MKKSMLIKGVVFVNLAVLTAGALLWFSNRTVSEQVERAVAQVSQAPRVNDGAMSDSALRAETLEARNSAARQDSAQKNSSREIYGPFPLAAKKDWTNQNRAAQTAENSGGHDRWVRPKPPCPKFKSFFDDHCNVYYVTGLTPSTLPSVY